MTPCSSENVRFVCNGLDHPEGLCFAADGSLVAGSESGRIYRIDPDAENVETVAETGGFVLGVCADMLGAFYVCDAGRNEVLRIDPDGTVETVASGGLDNPNDCAFDGEGNLFFTESGTYHPERHSGRLFVVTAGGETSCVHPGPFRFANGIFIDSNQNLLYMVESTAPSVLVFRLDGPKLMQSEPVRHIKLAPETVPDGVALDTDGNIYVAYYSPDQIGVIRDGRNLRGALLRLPCRMDESPDKHGAVRERNLFCQLRRLAHRCRQAQANARGAVPARARPPVRVMPVTFQADSFSTASAPTSVKRDSRPWTRYVILL